MQFQELTAQNAANIDALADDSITIDGQVFHHAVCINCTHITPLVATSVHDLTLADFQAAAQNGAQIALIGTGKQQQFLAPAMQVQIAQMGMGMESMNTAAACRTYALLTGEGRKVAAWLFL